LLINFRSFPKIGSGSGPPDGQSPQGRSRVSSPITLSPRRIIAGVSVRTRIVTLAMIPVAGFLINGIALQWANMKSDGR
jgi:hypothetical protein